MWKSVFFVQFLYLVFSFSLMYLVERWVPDKENGLQFRKQNLLPRTKVNALLGLHIIYFVARSLLVSLNFSLSLCPLFFRCYCCRLPATVILTASLWLWSWSTPRFCIMGSLFLHYLTLKFLGYSYRIE